MKLDNTEILTADELRQKTGLLKKDGYRLMALTALDFGSELEILYTFDKDLKVTSFRLRQDRDTVFNSISDIYFAAFLAENEIQDFYNVVFDRLAIDYKGHMLVEEEVRNLPYGSIAVNRQPDTKDKEE